MGRDLPGGPAVCYRLIVFRLLRFLISTVMLSAFLWFAATVPIGKRTLLGHIVRIARTDEARDLADGARETAKDVAKRMKDELQERDGGPPPAPRHRSSSDGAEGGREPRRERRERRGD